MPHVDVAGVRLFYEETGQGYPVVFVHEFGADHREWETQVRFFSRSYRCIAYNARGYPPSDVPDDPALYGWEFAADDVAGVMRALGIGRAHMVGLSMGGYAVLQCALRHPGLASAVVAAGAGSGSAPSQRADWLARIPIEARRFVEHGMEAAAEELGHMAGRIGLRRKDPRSWEEFMEHLRGHSEVGMSNTMARYQALRPSLYDFRAEFAGLRTPVLLAVGDEDVACLETNLMLKEAIPSAGLWVCPNTGHAINLEEPAAFNAEVQAFLSAAERGTWPVRGGGSATE